MSNFLEAGFGGKVFSYVYPYGYKNEEQITLKDDEIMYALAEYVAQKHHAFVGEMYLSIDKTGVSFTAIMQKEPDERG